MEALEKIRDYCLSLPHVTEDIKWEDDLVFSVGGKMFAVLALDPAFENRLSFKCTPEEYAVLIERRDVIPAPYLARYHWVTFLNYRLDKELREWLRGSYRLVWQRLPKKVRVELETPP